MPGQVLPTTGDTPFSSGESELSYIIRRAKELGLDPGAVLAVASHEGVSLPAIPGDNNSSFGPWQLHVGGALPANVAAKGTSYAQSWANSPNGIDYALTRMAGLAKGLRGPAAIRQIVFNFERPKDPTTEYARSVQTYAQGGGPKLNDGGASIGDSSFVNGIEQAGTGNPIGGAASIIGGIPGANSIPGVGAVTSVGDFFGKISDPAFALRAGEVVGGAFLMILGVYLLAKQVGLAPSIPSPVRAATSAVG